MAESDIALRRWRATGFQHPPREVGSTHVATAQDRGDAPPGEPVRFLEDGGDPKRCGRLHDESRVLMEHPHADLDRILANEHHVVEHDEQVVQHLRDRTAPGDAVGDRLDAVRLDHRSLAPRQRHRGRTNGLDSDHLHVLGERAHGVAHAAGHRSAADSHEHDVEPRVVSDELEADCGGALAGRQIQAVLDQIGATRL
ncbi:MAG: hypothetical protein JWL78_828, partial [Chloroflexi bacterium]|nr:hypothetical protein [Chloroflexota bacterium]